MILLVYFAVLLKSGRDSKIEIKVSPCLKFPYVCKSSDSFSESNVLGDYGNSYGTILFKEAACDGINYRTYIKTKNDVISYYNHFWGKKVYYSRHEPNKNKLFWFTIDVANDIYRPIEIPKLNYLTGKGGSFLIRLKDKFYVLSRELYSEESLNDSSALFYVAIIDATSGKELFMEGIENNLHLDLYYPIANRIVPVLQINRKGLYLHLIDILHNKTNTISWTIDEIRQIIIGIVNEDIYLRSVRKKVSQDILEQLVSAKFKRVNYIYNSNEGHVKYVKGINIYFQIEIRGAKYEYNLENLCIVLELEQESIRCYLELEYATFELNKSKGSHYKHHYKDTKILLQEINFSPEIPEIYFPNILYSNKCYDIVCNTENGIAITNKQLNILWDRETRSIYHESQFVRSAMYRYENYLFIVKLPADKDPSCLVVIDLKRNMIYPFISKGDFKILLSKDPEYRLEYVFHYFKLSNKFVFLSTDLTHMFVIKSHELKKKLYAIGHDECKEGYHEYVEDFVEILDLKQSLSSATSIAYKTQIEDKKTKVLSYYLDRDLDELYIIAEYNIDNKMYVGILKLVLSVERAFLRLITYYPYERLFYYKSKKLINLSHSTIYKVHTANTFNNNLKITCNLKPALIDIENNRVSIRMISKDFGAEKVTCKNLENSLMVELKYKRLSGLRVVITERELFVISRLNLVSEIPTLSL